jgi:hypothetical protein
MAEVTKIYDRYSHSAFTRGEMASAVGMSAGSGSFFAKAATLNMYGLIDESGGNVKVSPLFKALYQAPADSAELKRNAFQAIGKPAVFAGLLRSFGQRIPDESAIALRLEMQSNFNRDRAQQVAASFRSSLADYGLIDGSGNLLPVRESDSQRTEDAEDSGAEGVESHSGAMAPASPTPGPGMSRVEVPLANGRKAVVALPDDVTEADAKKICAILTAYATS